MKSSLALLLALVMTMTLFAGCRRTQNNDNTTQNTDSSTAQNAPESALQILQNIWDTYGEEEKFSIIGGNFENAVDNAPGNFDMAFIENLAGNLAIPQELLTQVSSAALMVHMMNANTFTAGAVQLKEDSDPAAFASTMQGALQSHPWICGIPETMLIATFEGRYVLIAFGAADLVGPFQSKLQQVYPDANIRHSENIG